MINFLTQFQLQLSKVNMILLMVQRNLTQIIILIKINNFKQCKI